MGSIKPLVAGNWKMNGLRDSVQEIMGLKGACGLEKGFSNADVMICPPATLIASFAPIMADSGLLLGGQDCHANVSGAYTGDISAEMLKDAGASAVIVGHSERRADHGETSEAVKEKALAAYRAGLVAIICIGETEAERKGGETLDVVKGQLSGSLPESANAANTVIAYEPVWAIGTGLTPTGDDVAEVHAAIRGALGTLVGGEDADSMRILYGGSVKPGNAKELMSIPNVNGALVGGASLKAIDFLGIVSVYGDAAAT